MQPAATAVVCTMGYLAALSHAINHHSCHTWAPNVTIIFESLLKGFVKSNLNFPLLIIFSGLSFFPQILWHGHNPVIGTAASKKRRCRRSFQFHHLLFLYVCSQKCSSYGLFGLWLSAVQYPHYCCQILIKTQVSSQAMYPKGNAEAQ